MYRCSGCALIYPNPLPIRTDNEHLETTSLEDFWGGRTLSYAHFDREIELLSGLIKRPLNELVVLDIGFGLGNSLVNMHAHCKEAHGIEPFEIFFNKAIEVNGSKLDTSKLQCIRFEDAEFPAEKFDFIFFEAIQHLPDLEACMKKALRFLKKEGILYVEVPSSKYLFNRLINLYYKFRGVDFVVDTNPMHGNFSYYAFSEESFVKNGKRLGYEVIHAEVLLCKPPVSGIAGRVLSTIMKYTGTSMQRSIWMRKV
jgi:ubiquinone/menaquinone biosynthesis C-methylase UbiE